MKKIYIDPGHGGKDSGAIGYGLKEKDVTLKIGLYTRDFLNNNYENLAVKMSRTKDGTISLKQRTDDANKWGADVLVSIHCNAFNGKAKGYEDYIYNGLGSNSKTQQLQNIMHEEISKLFSTDRGKKKANFHMLRESKMHAILTENGFIDNKEDNDFLKKDANLKKLGEAHAKGIAKFLGLKKKGSNKETDSKTFYRVIAGSFNNKLNAEKRVKELKQKGFDAFIDVYKK